MLLINAEPQKSEREISTGEKMSATTYSRRVAGMYNQKVFEALTSEDPSRRADLCSYLARSSAATLDEISGECGFSPHRRHLRER